ncbi:MAG TPA: hypothetical protein VN711_04070, partial [Candidatus Saccharimonadales bacterium]|nr:hypothetical protein [Candidatus Saccharimonadales bacterium]
MTSPRRPVTLTVIRTEERIPSATKGEAFCVYQRGNRCGFRDYAKSVAANAFRVKDDTNSLVRRGVEIAREASQPGAITGFGSGGECEG